MLIIVGRGPPPTIRSYSPVGPLVPEKRRGALLSIRLWTLGMPIRPALFDATFSAAQCFDRKVRFARSLEFWLTSTLPAQADFVTGGGFRYEHSAAAPPVFIAKSAA